MAQASSPDLLEGDPPAVTIRAGNALGSILEDTDAQVAAACGAVLPLLATGLSARVISQLMCIFCPRNVLLVHKSRCRGAPNYGIVDHALQYDAIHVGAAAASMPEKLIQKLAPGGRMVCHCPLWESLLFAAIHRHRSPLTPLMVDKIASPQRCELAPCDRVWE